MPTSASGVEKITVSLPKELIQYAVQRAAELGTSRSQLIGRAIAVLRAQEEEALAREGYGFYAAESDEFAAAILPAVSEAIVRTDG